MGRKDTAGRAFFSDRERFAELMNVHLFRRNKFVLAENLILREWEYPSLTGFYGEKKRDILIEDTSRKIYFGMELETESDYSMPERIMVYDVCEYERQVRELYRNHREKEDFTGYREKKSRIKATDVLCPTVTVVLYLGEGHWEGKHRLSELFRIVEKDAKLMGTRIHDYDFLLLEADYVNPEVYKTDLRQFFEAMQSRRDREKLRSLLRSEDFMNLRPETEQAIAAYLHVKRLFHKMKKEGLPMCKAFDDLMKEERRSGIQEGIKRGMQEGEKAGKRKERFTIIRKMHEKGMDGKLIRELTGCTKKELVAAVGK